MHTFTAFHAGHFSFVDYWLFVNIFIAVTSLFACCRSALLVVVVIVCLRLRSQLNRDKIMFYEYLRARHYATETLNDSNLMQKVNE